MHVQRAHGHGLGSNAEKSNGWRYSINGEGRRTEKGKHIGNGGIWEG